MWKFYSQDFVNYRGKTSDKERDYYTEIIAKWLLDNIELFNDIKMISRENSYKVDSHDGKIKNEKSEREEEIIAMKLFDFSQNQGKVFDIIGKIIDYQTPLKPENTKIKACPFVFYGKEQYKEMQEDRKYLKELIEKLGIEVIYLKEEKGEYSIVK